MNDELCIFCKIIKGEIPSYKVYEDENALAFLDINPVKDGHLLVTPKTHVEWMHEADDKTIFDAFNASKKLMDTMVRKLPCDFVQVSVVGKDVPHFHIHLIPRYHNDDLHGWPTKKYQPGEAEEIAEKLKN